MRMYSTYHFKGETEAKRKKNAIVVSRHPVSLLIHVADKRRRHFKKGRKEEEEENQVKGLGETGTRMVDHESTYTCIQRRYTQY